ncbi:MAG: MurR/RpiR family transcriptional regulator [Lautropia sp.]
MSSLPAAPRSLEHLRALVDRIRSGESGPRIGGRALAALDAIVATPQIAAISSISELAAANGVNASTLTRLSQRLGYSGFNAFQDVFRQQLSRTAAAPDAACRAAGVRPRGADGGAARDADAGLLAMCIANEEIGNIRATLEGAGSRALSGLADRLMRARRVRVAGANATHGAAAQLEHGLGLLRDDVDRLEAGAPGLAHALSALDGDDLLVVLDLAPHARAVVELVRSAVRLKIPHVVLCDRHDPAFGANAAQVVVCRSGGSAFPAATASMSFAIEVVLAIALRRLDTRGRRELLRRQRRVAELEAPAGRQSAPAVRRHRSSPQAVRP